MPTVDLKLLFADTQRRLAAQLQQARSAIGHPGDKGTVSENEWLELLTSFLPQRYCVAKATVVDSTGATSDSIDLVIFDRQYSPLVFEQRGFRYVAAEAVYAVFEVKQALNAAHVDYAAEKAASVRRLKRTSAAVTDIRGNTPLKQPIPILAGLLTTDIEWSPETAGEHLARHCSGLDSDHALDLFCAADSLGFEMTRGPERVELQASAPDAGLVFFMFGLLQRLQQVGTVAPIDFAAYRSAI
jgi:hypothetical protein